MNLLLAVTADEFGANADAWLNVILKLAGTIGTVVIGIIGVMALIKSKLTDSKLIEIEARQNRDGNKIEAVRQNVTAVALATHPIAGGRAGGSEGGHTEQDPVPTEEAPAPLPKKKARSASLFLVPFLLLASCATPSAPQKSVVTINGAPYKVTDGTEITYRDACGRYTPLRFVYP